MNRRERRLYREMVSAVRQWAAVAHPAAHRLRLLDEDEYGSGESIAAFHAEAPQHPDEFTLGDPEACRC